VGWGSSGGAIRVVPTAGLEPDELAALRALLDRAFADDADGPLTEEDWQHALGGVHVLAEADGRFVGHAAIVERVLHVADRPLRTGYVEAVAVDPTWQGRGIGSQVMEAAAVQLRDGYELGALATGRHGFYERLGWQTWRGPSFVRTAAGPRATPEEDGYILVLPTPGTPLRPLPLEASISCDWRPGDVW
jgi:aminoglycoside 2'-N-acetyltransferase I